jgi:hypothetical protein
MTEIDYASVKRFADITKTASIRGLKEVKMTLAEAVALESVIAHLSILALGKNITQQKQANTVTNVSLDGGSFKK